MLVKKLAVPLINEKILIQAEQCYIGTAAISEAAFDFVKGRLSPKCKINIVTGLDVITSPQVLRRVWRHYQDRITLNIYTRNPFHANVYIFDLPYKKSVAFVGSGQFTMDGLKDQEELFYKVTNPKEIEALMSWYTGYFEFAEPLTEAIIQEYDLIYPDMKQRDIASRQEKKQMIALTAGGFSWDYIKFKTQYFKKEDYLTFANSKASLDTEEVRAERLSVRNKLMELHEAVKAYLSKQKLVADSDHIVSSLDPKDHEDNKLRAMWITYGRSEAELKKYNPEAKLSDFMTIQVIIGQLDVGVWLVAGRQNTDRLYFKDQMLGEEYRASFFTLVTGLGVGYFIEIAGETKPVEAFQTPEALWEFSKNDYGQHYAFNIGKRYAPGDALISTESISDTMMTTVEKLSSIYNHLKAK